MGCHVNCRSILFPQPLAYVPGQNSSLSSSLLKHQKSSFCSYLSGSPYSGLSRSLAEDDYFSRYFKGSLYGISFPFLSKIRDDYHPEDFFQYFCLYLKKEKRHFPDCRCSDMCRLQGPAPFRSLALLLSIQKNGQRQGLAQALASLPTLQFSQPLKIHFVFQTSTGPKPLFLPFFKKKLLLDIYHFSTSREGHKGKQVSFLVNVSPYPFTGSHIVAKMMDAFALCGCKTLGT